ncbi:hypothetical protein LINPERHAP2_LOCUS27828 [Linum perenne]
MLKSRVSTGLGLRHSWLRFLNEPSPFSRSNVGLKPSGLGTAAFRSPMLPTLSSLSVLPIRMITNEQPSRAHGRFTTTTSQLLVGHHLSTRKNL